MLGDERGLTMAKGWIYRREVNGKLQDTWTARFDTGRDPSTGKRQQISKGGFRTEDEARSWADEQLALNGTGDRLLPSLVDPHGFFVYTLYGDFYAPLYVGQTANVFRRVGEHCQDPKKSLLIRRVGLLRCDTRDQALELERRLIKALTPKWNVIGRKRTGP